LVSIRGASSISCTERELLRRNEERPWKRLGGPQSCGDIRAADDLARRAGSALNRGVPDNGRWPVRHTGRRMI